MPFQRILANSIEKKNSKQVKTNEATKGLIKTVRLDMTIRLKNNAYLNPKRESPIESSIGNIRQSDRANEIKLCM